MSAAIQQAAISYFGLPDGTQMVEGGPMGHFAFTVPLTEEHLRGIADRMKALSEPAPQPERDEMITAPPSQEELRGIWSAMPAKEQGIYGSFGVFARRAFYDDCLSQAATKPEGRQVQHIDAPVEDESGLLQAVWVPANEATEAQKYYRVDTDIVKGFLVSSTMLTQEQRIKYAGGE